MERNTVTAVLMVSERAFEEETFTDEDLRLFETLAAHASVALSRASVVDRLRQLVAEREHDALHDALTGLPNRRAFTEAVERAMATGERRAVLLLDLDDFKDVNDTLGHSAGDGLLAVTGQRLSKRTDGFVARLGGDEFAILLSEPESAEPNAIAVALQRAVTDPVPLLDVELTTSASIGVAEFQGTSASSEEILGNADVAMYKAKRAHTGVEAYRPEDGSLAARRLALAADLPGALADGDLELHMQPQARAVSGKIQGFEALLRWSHPKFGSVPPPEIVAVAQRIGCMRALTDYIVLRALRAHQSWRAAGHELVVAVNITPHDIADATLPSRVASALASTGAPASALVLEIVESDALGDPERALSVLQALAVLGVRLSVDDFGTGYSSLAYLDRLPVHEVKIDQSFVFRLEQDVADATIVRATITLAHELGLEVVAEGVETDLATRLVTEMGCDVIQGFGLGRPMPLDQVLAWLDRRAVYRRSLADDEVVDRPTLTRVTEVRSISPVA
jgi:diguanylate cyclase (GGDEF)-like protein